MSPSRESALFEEIFRMSAALARIEERLDNHIEVSAAQAEAHVTVRKDRRALFFSVAALIVSSIVALKGWLL